MIMSCWRIYQPQHESTAFTGEGARLFGGRWNNKGVSVIYTAGAISLAGLEMLVHLEKKQLLATYRIVEVQFDSSMVTEVESKSLPLNWRELPAPLETQQVGDAWIQAAQSVVLRVPSTIVPPEFNYLLNPAHPDFGKLEFGNARNFEFDPRLVRA